MNAFQHVNYSGMEFVLRYKRSDGLWAAYDSQMNSVGLDESFVTYWGPRQNGKGEPVTHPIYFRETKKEIGPATIIFNSGYFFLQKEKRGKLMDDNHVEWHWDIDKLTFTSSKGCGFMRVMTPGGWWPLKLS